MLGTFFTHLRQQWMGGLALFLVLTGGSAYALTGTNTVFSDDIVNGEVKSADVATGAVRSAHIATGNVQSADIGTGAVTSSDVFDNNLTGTDVLDNSLKGVDVDEGSLNGALIPGVGSSPLVKSSGVIKVDDPGGDPTEPTVKPLLSAGPFTITGECADSGPAIGVGRYARVVITSSASNFSVDSDADGGIDEAAEGASSQELANTNEFGEAKVLDVGDYAAAAPSKFLAGEVFVGVNLMGTDCVFGVTGIG
jgi:hypothetical protein